MHGLGAEYRVAPLGLGVEEEALEPLAQQRLQGGGERFEHVRGGAVPNQHHLHRLRRALDHQLDVSERAAMALVGVGGHSCLLDRAPKRRGGIVDEGVMDSAVWRVDDAVGAGLEEADLGAPSAPTDSQPGAVPMTPSWRGMDARRRQAGVGCQLRQGLPCPRR